MEMAFPLTVVDSLAVSNTRVQLAAVQASHCIAQGLVAAVHLAVYVPQGAERMRRNYAL